MACAPPEVPTTGSDGRSETGPPLFLSLQLMLEAISENAGAAAKLAVATSARGVETLVCV